MLFHQSAAQATKKRVTVTHFTKKIIRTYLYITVIRKFYLWIFTDFSILLFAFWI